MSTNTDQHADSLHARLAVDDARTAQDAGARFASTLAGAVPADFRAALASMRQEIWAVTRLSVFLCGALGLPMRTGSWPTQDRCVREPGRARVPPAPGELGPNLVCYRNHGPPAVVERLLQRSREF